MSRNQTLILGALIVLLTAGIWFALPFLRHRPMHHVGVGSLAWAQQQKVAPGKTETLRLPSYLAAGSADGNVTVAHLKDGRYCILLKTAIGYKDNFSGRAFCSAPLQPNEIVDSPNARGRKEIELTGYGVFEELFVKSARNDREYEVYFDLN